MEVHINGKSIKRFSHEGKLFIEGHHDSEYAIRVQNNTNRRVLAILSVDGVNVVNGTEAKEASTGYVIAAYGAITVKGFRESNDHIGTFKFSTKEKSYTKTTATGSMQDCGVIGCMIVEEKVKPISIPTMLDWEWRPSQTVFKTITPYIGDSITSTGNGLMGVFYNTCGPDNGEKIRGCVPDMQSYSSSLTLGDRIGSKSVQSANLMGSVTPSSKKVMMSSGANINNVDTSSHVPGDAKDFDLGTAWGQRVLDKVEYVDFERGDIAETIVIYYASRDVLLSQGVSLVVKKAISFPNAFPAQYCKAPPGYNG